MANNDNIKLQEPIDITISNIDKDIKNISEILDNIYKAVLTLNESKWNTKEKKKMEEEFIPYLKTISLKYPKYLNDRLKLLQNAVEKYRTLNKDLQNETAKLES